MDKDIFWYVVIFCVIIFIVSRMDIKLNVVFGTGIAIIIIMYMYNQNQSSQIEDNLLRHEKQDLIYPRPKYTIEYANDDIIDFLFSIQDFYPRNPQAYEDMIESCDQFFILYHEIKTNSQLANFNYQNLIDLKRSMLNSLQSILINMVPNVGRDNKLQESITVLDIILNRYLDEIKRIHDEYLYEHGYDIHTTLINTGEDASNMYDDKLFTYDMY